MAYLKKKGLSSAPNKGGGSVAKKLPYSGGKAEATPLKKEAKKLASSAVRGTVTGIGGTVTKTNRATGASTTNKKTLTPTTKSGFSSGSGKLMKTAAPRKEETGDKIAKKRTRL